MRWSIIRLIWLRELRDQLRDRRTVFMMAVLPLVLYPLIGLGLLQFAMGNGKKSSFVGIVGADYLPQQTPLSVGCNALPVVPWLTVNPGGGAAALAASAAQSQLTQQGLGQNDPPLLIKVGGEVRFATAFGQVGDPDLLSIKILNTSAPSPLPGISGELDEWLKSIDRSALDEKRVDVLLIVPPDFTEQLNRSRRVAVIVLARPGDEHSKNVSQRVHVVLDQWKKRLKEVRFLRSGLPGDFDEPLEVKDPETSKSSAKQIADGLLEMLVRIIPFMIVMWSLAGALYPAVDLCAGEKERGTMETLLISPAAREEIVLGKFLTIWVFSAATALLNLLSLAGTTWHFRDLLPSDALRIGPIFWCVLLVLPLSAFFSAVCLAIGAYARSTKEGQYYLMPLFLLTMPLMFLSLAPGVELNPFYCMVPVTGVALLMQRLMLAASPDQAALFYLLPVLAPMALYGWLALRWAIEQFQREEVLFREAERLDVGLWFKQLFRAKEALPSTGQALFCFGLILLLRFLSLGWGAQQTLLERTAIGFVGFVLPVPLFMALILTSRPRQGLALKLPPVRLLLAAGLLALALVPPRVEVKNLILGQYPGLNEQRKENHELTEGLHAWIEDGRLNAPAWQVFLAVAVLPALCEELAFRGLILSGLRRRYGPWKAIALSSFLFALYHMNVFKFAPAFILGLVLGLLTERSRSLLPAVMFQITHNGLRVGLVVLNNFLDGRGYRGPDSWPQPIRWGIVTVATILAILILGRLIRGPSKEVAKLAEGSASVTIAPTLVTAGSSTD
ncbi:MAG: ABC transporter permease subunit/CPBP intramembrane protease [Gemmataceae bacterium]